MTKAKIQKLEKMFRDDIRWAIRNGMKWDAEVGASFVDGKWVSKAVAEAIYWERKPPKVCGVCAVAAHVVRHQTEAVVHRDPDDADCVVSAAKSLHVDEMWLEDLFVSVTDSPEYDNADDSESFRLGHRLRDYAEAYTKKYKAEQKRKRVKAAS